MHNACMTLDQYLTKTGETDAAFAGRAGLSQTQINRLKRGVSSPSFASIKKIAKASGGKVKFADWAEQWAAKGKPTPIQSETA